MKRWAFGWVLLLPLAIGGKSPQHSPLGDVPEPPPAATTAPVAPLPQEAIDPSGWLTSSLRLSLLKYYLSSYPSFESDRLDEQLMNYRRYLATHGAPDILIVGSSRALQGIDPAYLQQALIDQATGTSRYTTLASMVPRCR
ncbi:MAG: hypothetical protein HC925_08550 [Coleofasciculaceae cyanobacterium SM2_3_26]|nr:hypothetical protein [Coleofasciculaceae cyanobacterium SM2_3_26]